MKYESMQGRNPELAKEWHPTKNKRRLPTSVSTTYSKKVWWLKTVEKDGQFFDLEWVDSPRDRIAGKECPFLTIPPRKILKGFNDISTTNPECLEEWDYEKNYKDLQFRISAYYTKKVWWIKIVERNGNKFTLPWDMSPKNYLINNQECPYLSKPPKKLMAGLNDLKTIKPEIAKLWDNTKNGNLKPEMFFPFSKQKVHWCHDVYHNGKKFHHSWERKICNMKKFSCSTCSGKKVEKGFNDFESNFPELLDDWDYERNDFKPDEITKSCHRIILWKCRYCGKTWGSAPHNRSKCPKCYAFFQTSFSEQAQFYYIRRIFPTAKNRHKINGFEFDNFIEELKIAIENNGDYTHSSTEKKKADERKKFFCEQNGIRLIRIIEVDNIKNQLCKDNYIIRATGDDLLIKPQSSYKHIPQIMMFIKVKLEDILGHNIEFDVDIIRDEFEILKQYNQCIYDHSIAAKHPELIKFYNYDKNVGLSPERIPHSSKIHLHWKHLVEFDGKEFVHEWLSIAENGKKITSCPFCNNRLLQEGFNDLKTREPKLAAQFDYEKNYPFTPDKILCNYSKPLYWIETIENRIHRWPSTIYNRLRGRGSPILAGKVIDPYINSLAITHPKFAAQWDRRKNGFGPETVSKGYPKVVNWVHFDKKNGKYFIHRWRTSPNSRTNKDSGCPYCSGLKIMPGYNDFATLYPSLLKLWDHKKNKSISPSRIASSDNMAVHWTDKNRTVIISSRVRTYNRHKKTTKSKYVEANSEELNNNNFNNYLKLKLCPIKKSFSLKNGFVVRRMHRQNKGK
jgi:hypothetical protein